MTDWCSEMKNVFLIGGTMGAGKTTVCRILKKKLNRSVFLDGDWCWDMNPFQITDETKQMVMNNICFLLNSFIRCSAYENIIFCWVMHEQSIIDELVCRLDLTGCKAHAISLVCSGQSLRARLQRDIEAGIRERDIISRSEVRISMYDRLKTTKVDVSDIAPEQAADNIILITGMRK